MDVGDRRLVVEVAEALLAFAQCALEAQPRQLRGRTGGEDAEDGEIPRLERHGLGVEYAEMSEVLIVGSDQRYAEVALDPPVDHKRVPRELLAHAGNVMARFVIDEFRAGRILLCPTRWPTRSPAAHAKQAIAPGNRR